MKAALVETPKATPALFIRLDELEVKLAGLKTRLSGDRVRQRMNESTVPSISSRVGRVAGGHWNTRQTPTETQKRNIEIAQDDFGKFRRDLVVYFNDLSEYEATLEVAGAPWTPGRKLK